MIDSLPDVCNPRAVVKRVLFVTPVELRKISAEKKIDSTPGHYVNEECFHVFWDQVVQRSKTNDERVSSRNLMISVGPVVFRASFM